jgi:hypothetical protein
MSVSAPASRELIFATLPAVVQARVVDEPDRS